MDDAFLDDFLLSDSDLERIPPLSEAMRATLDREIQQRYDVFRGHRGDDMNIVELNLSYEPPAPLLYDWYRSDSGWTVSLEAPASLCRPWGVPITIRVRHEDDEREPTFHKLGRTVTFDERDPELLERVRREIGEAFCEGESPLWRLRQQFELPDFIVDVIEERVDYEHIIGTLELKGTEALLLTMVLEPGDLLDAMHARASTYKRRRT